MSAAGDGDLRTSLMLSQMLDKGSPGLISTRSAMGMVGDRKSVTICYEPAIELRCGMGCVYWEMEKEPANV